MWSWEDPQKRAVFESRVEAALEDLRFQQDQKRVEREARRRFMAEQDEKAAGLRNYEQMCRQAAAAEKAEEARKVQGVIAAAVAERNFQLLLPLFYFSRATEAVLGPLGLLTDRATVPFKSRCLPEMHFNRGEASCKRCKRLEALGIQKLTWPIDGSLLEALVAAGKEIRKSALPT